MPKKSSRLIAAWPNPYNRPQEHIVTLEDRIPLLEAAWPNPNNRAQKHIVTLEDRIPLLEGEVSGAGC